MDDNLAGTICLVSSLILLCIFLYILVHLLKSLLLSTGDECIKKLYNFQIPGGGDI